jgi:hypothetical protein
MVHVAALIFCLEDFNSFIRGNPARSTWVVLGDESRKRLSDDQANI